MSQELHALLTLSLVALAALVGYVMIAHRRVKAFAPWLLALGAASAVVMFLAPTTVETRGTIDETAAVALCYIAMVLGMIAEYYFAQAEHGKKKFTFDLTKFMMPIFASPIVFIPLLTLTTDVAAGGVFSRSKLMVYLVAFQNGFFWKRFFEDRRRTVEKAEPPHAQAA